MATEIIANENFAVFVQNTSGEAFGPAISVARHGERANRRVAQYVLDNIDEKLSVVWYEDPDLVRRYVAEAKNELYPDIPPSTQPTG